ncbi:hypothetical protein SSA02_09070 [Swaminathania salitolerans]|uniref:Uncharacterized protein n=1 Tax=Swaminathania salitolerans TaxID=182838 RepID=A0A511BQ30_9PROT|nr:hypothetical protein SSA02_09070 [Swaminathania salitolerans]
MLMTGAPPASAGSIRTLRPARQGNGVIPLTGLRETECLCLRFRTSPLAPARNPDKARAIPSLPLVRGGRSMRFVTLKGNIRNETVLHINDTAAVFYLLVVYK